MKGLAEGHVLAHQSEMTPDSILSAVAAAVIGKASELAVQVARMPAVRWCVLSVSTSAVTSKLRRRLTPPAPIRERGCGPAVSSRQEYF
jgi:hypothetical protein